MKIDRTLFYFEAVIACCCLAFTGADPAIAANDYNVLFLVADDFRYDAVGINGNPVVKTPNIDALAQEGVRFTHAFAQKFSCTPTRVAMLTGRYPHTNRATSNHTRLRDSEITLPEILRDEGYFTAGVGKMTLNEPGINQGFRYIQAVHNELVHTIVDGDSSAVSLGTKALDFTFDRMRMTGTYNGPVEQFRDRYMTHSIMSLMEEHRHDKFFIWAAFHATHRVTAPPEPWASMYKADDMSLPPSDPSEFDRKPPGQRKDAARWTSLTDDEKRQVIASYYGDASHMDYHVGMMVEKLRELGLLKKTLIVFVGDQGVYLGEHGMQLKNTVSLYDQAVRIPVHLRLPDALPKNTTVEGLVEQIDLMPTILKVLDIPVPYVVQGKDLIPLIRGEKKELRDAVFAQHFYSPQYKSVDPAVIMTMVRNYEYKLIYRSGGISELYDLRSDPHELNNIADREPGIVSDMKHKILDWYVETQAKDPHENP
jgi:arylsulfatase A-like enzyme